MGLPISLQRSVDRQLPDRPCQRCQSFFAPRAYNAKWCDECRPVMQLAWRAESRKRNPHPWGKPKPPRPPHPTVVLFKRVWPDVRGVARRTQKLVMALARAQQLVRGERNPAARETVVYACRFRLTEGKDKKYCEPRKSLQRVAV